ncbi:MAG TPA: SgcJ/EcaC family oxidoreductase [Ktedonobacterales bacterium]|nr:SgcJ/EcaC family oxidoreductase [Ktedonobacterales bacterium]
MTSSQPNTPETSGDAVITALYAQLLDSWNRRDASAFAALFDDEGQSIGFDGSPMSGRDEIAATLGQIFADHITATYVARVRGIRLLAPDVALLRAVVGMVPPGQSDINPAVNAMQTIVAVNRAGEWRIALLQNTPAQFHGRPEMAEALTQELRALL